MAENELCVVLSNVGVDKDEDLIAWRKKNQELVSIDDAGSKLKVKKPSKLTLIFTEFKKIQEFQEFQENFKNFWSKLEKIPDFSLQTLHLIFLAQGVEIVSILKMSEFFKNLQYKTIELDCKFTVPVGSYLNQEFLESLGEDQGIRVRLGSTTTSVTVRSPRARIIELCNDDFTKFSLQRINLTTKYYPMGIILCNIDPNVIKDKILKVYWNGEKKPKTLQLKNPESAKGNVIYIGLPQPASSDKTSIELYVLLADTVKEDSSFSRWETWNFRKQDVVLVNNAGSKLKAKKPNKLTLMLTKYETTVEFSQLWEKFEESLKSLTEPLQTLHFIFLAPDAKIQEDIIEIFTLKKDQFFKNLQCENIELDCEFTVPLQLPSDDFLPLEMKDKGIRVNLGSTTTSVTVRCPDARIIQIYNDDPTKFNLVQVNLTTNFYSMVIILCNVNLNVIKKKRLEVNWNNVKQVTLKLENFKSVTEHIILIQLTQPALSDESESEVKVKKEKVKRVKDKNESKKGGGGSWQYYCSIVDSCLGEECDV
jgi:hypothetical protein